MGVCIPVGCVPPAAFDVQCGVSVPGVSIMEGLCCGGGGVGGSLFLRVSILESICFGGVSLPGMSVLGGLCSRGVSVPGGGALWQNPPPL